MEPSFDLGPVGLLLFTNHQPPATLLPVASHRESQRPANFLHSRRAQLRHALPQTCLRHGNGVMQIHCTRRLHTVFFPQGNFGRHASNGRRDRSDRHRRQVLNRAVPRQHHDRPFLVRRSEVVKPHISTRYFSGHAASASHRNASSPPIGARAYPRRSCSSSPRTSSRFRCSRSASRTRAERFRFVLRAA